MGLTKARTATVPKKREHGRGGRAIRISIALVLVTSALAIGGGVTRNAAAATTWQNAAGWEGNYVIYMNAWISSVPDAKGFGPYFLPEWNVSSVTTTDEVKNAVGVAVGVRSQDASGNLLFGEDYQYGYGYLQVTIPLAVIGESYTYDDWTAQCVYESVQDVYLPYVGMSITREDNFGINATGTLYPGTPPITKAQNDIIADAWWSGVEALLGGAPVGTWNSMYQSYVAAAKAVGSPNVENFTQGSSSAGQQVIQSYDVTSPYWGGTGNSPTYNVFGPSMYIDMTINKTDFSTMPSSQPALTVYGENWINPQGYGCIAGQVQGANIPLNIFAYPAIEVEGTVSLGSRTLANQLLTLSDGGSNVYTFSTNSQGNYRFFAKPGTTYTLSTTYGSAQWQTTFTTGTDPTVEAPYENLNIPAFSVTAGASPNPTQPGVNVSLWANLAGGYISPVSFSWSFGDGTYGTGQDPGHVYKSSGTFQANVTATDSSNPVQTAQSTVSVVVQNPCDPTKACVTPSSQTVYYGICSSPKATVSGFPATSDVGPFTYSWNFGDGTTGGNLQTISHTYAYVATTYTVTLTITDGAGTKSTATAKVTVKNMGKICAPSP